MCSDRASRRLVCDLDGFGRGAPCRGLPRRCLFTEDPIPWVLLCCREEVRMRPNPDEAPRDLITERRATLDTMPTDESRNDLRQSLQRLIPLLEQLHRR